LGSNINNKQISWLDGFRMGRSLPAAGGFLPLFQIDCMPKEENISRESAGEWFIFSRGQNWKRSPEYNRRLHHAFALEDPGTVSVRDQIFPACKSTLLIGALAFS
jgi:hypothetical protein